MFPVGLSILTLFLLGIAMLWTIKGTECPKSLKIQNSSIEGFSNCTAYKQIYLNGILSSGDHADVNLENRFGKLFIYINANLPYALGGVFHTLEGSYQAFLIDRKNGLSINLGSLIRHGDRFYKLATSLEGNFDNYDEIHVYRRTENHEPVLVLKGNICEQNRSSL
jgi:hypothetical protein